VLLTDYGTRDHYVGQVKAVIAGIAPSSPIIDLSHEVHPFAVDEGAWMLETALPVLPENAIVLAVVDPGVGTPRKPIAVRYAGRDFVGPDNGLLSTAFPAEMRRKLRSAATVAVPALDGLDVRELCEPQFRRPAVSRTFHGRDIFAPAAAHIAAGVNFRQFGPPVARAVVLPEWGAMPQAMGQLQSYVVHVDRYGNLITTIRASQLFPSFELVVNNVVIDRHVRTFGDAAADEAFCHVDSSGFIAIAVKEASAAERLGVARGTPVTVRAR